MQETSNQVLTNELLGMLEQVLASTPSNGTRILDRQELSTLHGAVRNGTLPPWTLERI